MPSASLPTPAPSPRSPGAAAILYVGARLPELSETFVYRELLGLRGRGRRVLAASVHAPRRFADDPVLAPLAAEALVVYAPATLAALPLALLRHPGLAIGALGDAARADHPGLSSRLKHVAQALMGLAAGWRLRGEGIGHVHAHMAHVPATVALYIARALGARFSFTGHAADLFVQRAALAFKLRRAGFVASISHWHHDFYGEVAGIAPDRRPVVRCSVAIPEAVADTDAREIVLVARLVAKKGVDLLLRAFATAGAEGWTLRILGDGPERAALAALAVELGITERVIFEGARPHAACLAAIAGAGLFVLPCRTAKSGDKDGIPVVLMEAMAAGRAVIAGDLPTIRELVSDEREGLLVPPDDVAALAAAIGALAGDPARRAAIGAAARAHVAAEFSDAVNLDRLTAAIDAAREPA
ncbi:glycosyltransferase [Sphingomonas quercus]|uniref:Glycosyltransferase n=1 Tax=Sphingomonas quercus TaxID=2842451 RepID=A0ABS6BFW1_9SPHN|nr:glycosyltransferase [Sphingomonas quercus]MBU3077188.1 glycosyltransferase [Sphingomonas quercus]